MKPGKARGSFGPETHGESLKHCQYSGNTGDMAPIATMIVIAGLAAVCAVVVYKRKEA